jgi:hypothetical protein
MVQFFESETLDSAAAVRRWTDDPLSHPAIAAMTLEQIADLPFEPHAALPCPQGEGGRAGSAGWVAGMLGRLTASAVRPFRGGRRASA